jgi:iron-sulfur cluster insertion protein
MIEVTIAPDVLDKFKEIFAREDNEDAVFRIRETKVGGGCRSRMELRVSIDEREDADEEKEVQIDGMTFLAHNNVIESYGNKFTIFIAECGNLAVKAS